MRISRNFSKKKTTKVRNKLVQRIFAVVRDERNYVENYQYQRA